MKNFNKESAIEFCILAGKRALWTFAEVTLFMIGSSLVGFSAIDWEAILDVAFGAATVSVLKSIVFSMPEFENDGNLLITDNTCQLNLGKDEEAIKAKKSVRLKIIPDTTNKE